MDLIDERPTHGERFAPAPAERAGAVHQLQVHFVVLPHDGGVHAVDPEDIVVVRDTLVRRQSRMSRYRMKAQAESVRLRQEPQGATRTDEGLPVTVLLLLPVVLSLLVLGAHFLRGGSVVLVAVVLAVVAMLGVRRPWVARLVQATLLLGALEWVRSLVQLTGQRMQEGQPATRLVAILGGVALFTGLSALVFHTTRLRLRFGLGAGVENAELGTPAGSGAELRDE